MHLVKTFLMLKQLVNESSSGHHTNPESNFLLDISDAWFDESLVV